MKYQVGDKILLLHSQEEGIILEILSQEMARIEVDGIDFPVYLDQIDFPYYYNFSKKNQPAFPGVGKGSSLLSAIPKEKGSGRKNELDGGLSIIFFPVIDNAESAFLVAHFKVYLSNQMPLSFSFSYSFKKKGQLLWSMDGASQSETDFYLHDILFEDLSDNPVFNFKFNLVGASSKFQDQLTTSVKLKPRQLFEQLEKVRTQKLASFSISIIDNYPEKDTLSLATPVTIKPTVGISPTSALHQQDFIDSFSHIVDLHIENLLTDWKGLSNFEILQTQLAHFDKVVERTIRNQHPTLVVIHGVGEGKLKSEIHQLLRQMKEVHFFENKYDPRFGQGATTIHFQY